MLSLIRNKLRTATLRAQYERELHEQLAHLSEAYNQPVAEDPGRWTLMGADQRTLDPQEREDARTQSRRLARTNPHAANVLRMLEAYVAGPGLQLHHKPDDHTPADAGTDDASTATEPADAADARWLEFLRVNRGHFSYRELYRRVQRDGEAFLRFFSSLDGVPRVRFIDPELIAPTPEHPNSAGILTDPRDVETPTFYLQIDPETQQLTEKIPAAQVLHVKIGADSNEKRGIPRLHTIARTLECYESWVDVELRARKLQASIVLWRKVQGTPSAVEQLANQMSSDVAAHRPGSTDTYRQERFQPGSILTTNHNTEIEFLQPKTNLRDAVPLGRMLLLGAAAGVGMPEFMLTSDASNANYASTMIAEGPAVKLFQAEQEWFRENALEPIWRHVIGDDSLQPNWRFPELVNRDKHQERKSDHDSVAAKIISRAEACRRDGVDPEEMRREIESEKDLEPKPENPTLQNAQGQAQGGSPDP